MTGPVAAEDNSGARAFYQAMHQAFDLTLDRHARQPRLIDALMSQAFDSFQGNVAIQCEDEPPLACHRGCAACCTLRVGATAPEVLLVTRYLRTIMPKLMDHDVDLLARIRAVDGQTQGLSEAERVTLRKRCPFLERGVCFIYSVRPLACRGHASHDVRACNEAAAGRREEVPYSNGHRMVRALVQNAMQSSLRDAGLPWKIYELNQAVLSALESPDAEGEWLRGGDDAIAGAMLNEVPEAEMKLVYDSLRPGASAGT